MSAIILYGPWTEKNRKANRELARFNLRMRKQLPALRREKQNQRVLDDAVAAL